MRHLKLLGFSLVLLTTATAFAQSTAGSMSGSVVDAQGQVVPGANVTITNENTAEARTTVSNEIGEYVFPTLQPGPYTVRAELQGFKPFEIKNNVVLANNRLTVRPLRLEVGQLAETVSVTAVGETIATTVTSHQAIMNEKQIETMSIRGRDPISLLKVLPGVGSLANDQETFGGSFSTPVPNIQGGRGQTIYVDGINGGDGGGGGNFSAAVNMDAVEEVNVQMSAYTAEYGLKGGAQVNLITKHGGSEYHGTGYWYKRHEGLNATNFFNNKAGVPKPVYRYSTQGGTIGGPIPKIPKINAEKNKLFFFYSIDDTQLKDVNILRFYTVPTAAERQGDFSNSRLPNGALITITDPQTGQPFPGNQIPVARMDQRAMALINLIPLPNASGAGYNYTTQEPSIPHPRRQHLIRLDYRPTSNQTLSAKYSSWYTRSVGWNVAGASSRWGLVRQRYDFTTDQFKLDYTRVLNSSTILELNAGEFYSTELGPPENDQQLAHIQRTSYPAIANLPQWAPFWNPLNLIPTVNFGTVQSNSREVPNITYDGRWPITGADTAVSLAASVTHTRGTHTYKAGILREHEIFGQARSGTFGGDFNFQSDSADPLNTGYAYANAFLGHVTTYTESMGKPPDDREQNTWAWYAQDTWKITPKLTVDYGLRMYKWSPPLSQTGEASGFSFERFDPTWSGKPPVLFIPVTTAQGRRAQNPLTGEIFPVSYVGLMVPGTGFTCDVITPGNPCKINGVVSQSDSSYTNAGVGFINKVPIQLDPRFGIAWAPNQRTVIRVSGGSFHDGTGGSTLQQGNGNAAWRFQRIVRYTDMSNYLTGQSVTTVPGQVIGVIKTDNVRPNNRRYTAAIQRDLGKHIVLDVAYVGDNTTHLGRDYNYNAIPAGAQFLAKNRDLTVPDSATVGLDPTKANPGALPDVFLRPIVGFGDLTITRADGKSNYNSLQTQLSRRFTGGLELAGSYTYAKGRTNIMCCNNDNSKPDVANFGNSGQYQGNGVPTSFNDFARPIQAHVLVMSFVYEVPNASKFLGAPSKWVLDSWRLSGVTTLASGLPRAVTYTTTDNFNFTGGGATGERCGSSVNAYPDKNGDANLADRTFDRWFNTSVFSRPTGRGDVTNNCDNFAFTGPGFRNQDLTLFKEFPTKKGQAIQFRWEIYNLFNTVQGWEVDSNAQFDAAGNQTNTNFGKVTSARNERRMQLGLRYTW
jgi:Carboxypeptidase regulatory-like domain